MYLTQHPDIDINIIRQLPWEEMNFVCQSNKDIHQLCQHNTLIQNNIQDAKQKSNRVISLLSTYSFGITVQPSEDYFAWDIWIHLLNLHHIPLYLNQRNYNNSNHLGSITIKYHEYSESIIIDFIMYKKKVSENTIHTYKVNNINQLFKFLTHCYYDNMILLV